MTYLYAAITVTWVIHIAYLAYLTKRFARVRDEAAELEKK
jgi:hypothetical protein